MSAKYHRIHRNYDKLQNQERLKLVANALLRDDDDEFQALVASTPRKNYVIRDKWMVDRSDALWRISISYWLAMEILWGEWEKSDNLILKLIIRMNRELNNKQNISVIFLALEMVYDRKMENAGLIRAASLALEKLAQEVDLSPEELTAYLAPEVRESFNFTDSNMEVEISEDAVIQYYNLFRKCWPGSE